MIQNRGNSTGRNTDTKHGEQKPEAEVCEEQADKEGGESELKAGDFYLRKEVPACTEKEADKG